MVASLARYVEFYSIVIAVVRPAVVAPLLAGLWVALGRAGVRSRGRSTAWWSIAAPLVAWLVGVWILAARGAFQVSVPGSVPWIPVAVATPVIVASIALRRSRALPAALDAAPLSWLIGLQAYRVIGANFIVLWLCGVMPGVFAGPAGIGDVLVGLLAIPAGLYAASGRAGGRAIAVAWNLFGIADLVNALALGFLSAPGPLQRLALDHPNALVGSYPTVLIPVFAVPLSLVLHGVSLWQLRRRASNFTRGSSSSVPPNVLALPATQG